MRRSLPTISLAALAAIATVGFSSAAWRIGDHAAGYRGLAHPFYGSTMCWRWWRSVSGRRSSAAGMWLLPLTFPV